MSRRFQFSLRALLVIMTATCMWLALCVERAQRQRKAVKAIQSAPGGGSVSYEVSSQPGGPRLGWIKKWLCRVLGDEYVLTPEKASIAAFATDADLEALRSLGELRAVIFNGNRAITAAGLRHLKGLTKLEYLYARQINITDDGLVHLEGLVNLRDMDLGLNPITSAGLRHLQPLGHLRGIDLTSTKVDDAGLRYLADKTDLLSLSLWSTNVTDSGLVHLRGLKNLLELDLTATGVTKQGVAELQKHLPKCSIMY
jgi:hypothetical protein